MNILISKEDIQTQIKNYENTAQEYYQDIGDEPMGDCENAKAESLKNLIKDSKEVEVLDDFNTNYTLHDFQRSEFSLLSDYLKSNKYLIVKIIE